MVMLQLVIIHYINKLKIIIVKNGGWKQILKINWNCLKCKKKIIKKVKKIF